VPTRRARRGICHRVRNVSRLTTEVVQLESESPPQELSPRGGGTVATVARSRGCVWLTLAA